MKQQIIDFSFKIRQLEKGSEVKAESRFPDSFFYSRQEYDVSVAVDMPESNPNIDLGNWNGKLFY